MTLSSNTRIWQGSVLSVRNSGDSAWVDFSNCIDYSMPGTPSATIDASTAASTVDQFRLGIPNRGKATFNVFDYMDSPFLAAMDAMQDGGETRKFKLVIPEGTRTTRIFTGYVIDAPITGTYNTLWKMTLDLKVVTDFWFNAPLTAASMSPSTGAAAGGTAVTVTGTGFVDGETYVTIGGNTVVAADVTVNSSTSLTFTTPAHSAGVAATTVTSPETTTANITGGFTYS
jgi:hypothetical protein